jgi:limonene-1,2-epoxide hydrolase
VSGSSLSGGGPGGDDRLAERYLRAVAAQDWPTVVACLAPGVVRHGPFGHDTVVGADAYLDYLRHTMPALAGYRLDIDRITDTGGGRVFVELRETVLVEGAPLLTHECLVFGVADRRIETVAIYIRQDGGTDARDGGVP